MEVTSQGLQGCVVGGTKEGVGRTTQAGPKLRAFAQLRFGNTPPRVSPTIIHTDPGEGGGLGIVNTPCAVVKLTSGKSKKKADGDRNKGWKDLGVKHRPSQESTASSKRLP